MARRSCFFLCFIEVQVGFEHQGKWWQIDCHHNVSQGGGGVMHLYCHLTQPWDPQSCHDFQSMSRSSSHLHSNISLMFRYIIFQFAFNIFSCGINYIIHHIHSYYILYQSNYIIHHITSSDYNLPTFPQISTVFWALPLLPTIPRPSPDHPQRSPEASAVKHFLRHHEAPDLRFAEFVTPQRMVELFPLAGTTLGYSALARRERMDELNLWMYI